MAENIKQNTDDESIEIRKKVTINSLLILAKGVVLKEKTEEFVTDGDGSLTLKSRKIIRKQLAPDLQAIKMLDEIKTFDDMENMSDEELEKEKQKLLEEIKKS